MASVVLIVSDIGLREAWRAELEAHRHVVLLATTAMATMDRLREGGIDLLLIDHEVIGGIRFLLAGLDSLPDAPPFVLISAAVDAPALSAHIGAAAFLPKEYAVEELAAVVHRVASGSSSPIT
jgi:DNA-binding NarL/FixJ family response regulator